MNEQAGKIVSEFISTRKLRNLNSNTIEFDSKILTKIVVVKPNVEMKSWIYYLRMLV